MENLELSEMLIRKRPMSGASSRSRPSSASLLVRPGSASDPRRHLADDDDNLPPMMMERPRSATSSMSGFSTRPGTASAGRPPRSSAQAPSRLPGTQHQQHQTSTRPSSAISTTLTRTPSFSEEFRTKRLHELSAENRALDTLDAALVSGAFDLKAAKEALMSSTSDDAQLTRESDQSATGDLSFGSKHEAAPADSSSIHQNSSSDRGDVPLSGEAHPSQRIRSRYAHYKERLMTKVADNCHPALATLCSAIFHECEGIIRTACREAEVDGSVIGKDAISDLVSKLLDTERALADSQSRVAELESVTQSLTRCNAGYEKNQRRLENALDELRMSISLHASRTVMLDPLHEAQEQADQQYNKALFSKQHESEQTELDGEANELGAGPSNEAHDDGLLEVAALRPDLDVSIPFANAIHAMSMEIQVLREENDQLSDSSTQHADAFAHQSEEMSKLLDRANGFQKQVGELKSTMRVMKAYIDRLEDRVLELSTVYRRMHTANYQRLFDFAGYRALALPVVDSCFSGLSQALTLKNQPSTVFGVPSIPPKTIDFIDLSSVAKDIDILLGTNYFAAEERTTQASSLWRSERAQVFRRKTLPEHLLSSVKTASMGGRLKNKVFSADETRYFCEDAFSAYTMNQYVKKPGQQDTFAAFLSSTWYPQKAGQNAKTQAELALTIHYLTEQYQQRCRVCFLFQKLSMLEAPTELIKAMPDRMLALHDILKKVESTNKKQKDKIPRSEFMKCVREWLPAMTEQQQATVALLTIIGQDKYNDDVSYETYFEKSSAGSTAVWDFLNRVLIEYSGQMQAKLEQAVLRRTTESFERTRRMIEKDKEMATRGDARKMVQLENLDQYRFEECALSAIVDGLAEVDPHCPPSEVKRRVCVAAGDPTLFSAALLSYDERVKNSSVDFKAAMERLQAFVALRQWPPGSIEAELQQQQRESGGSPQPNSSVGGV